MSLLENVPHVYEDEDEAFVEAIARLLASEFGGYTTEAKMTDLVKSDLGQSRPTHIRAHRYVTIAAVIINYLDTDRVSRDEIEGLRGELAEAKEQHRHDLTEAIRVIDHYKHQIPGTN